MSARRSETAGDEAVPIDPDLEVPARPGPQGSSGHPPAWRPAVLAAISAGGMLGASARYGVARLWPASAGQFPWATFWTNVSGSLLLGFVVVVMAERFPPSRYLRPFVAIGFIGAYTTFSTYAVETDVLMKDGHVVTGLLYGVSSLVVGLAAAWAGLVAGRAASRDRMA